MKRQLVVSLGAVASLMVPMPGKAEGQCTGLVQALNGCTPYACQMLHGVPTKRFKHQVIGLQSDGSCQYTQTSKLEGISVELTLECHFSESIRSDFADTLRVATGQFKEGDDFTEQGTRVNEALKYSEICTIRN